MDNGCCPILSASRAKSIRVQHLKMVQSWQTHCAQDCTTLCFAFLFGTLEIELQVENRNILWPSSKLLMSLDRDIHGPECWPLRTRCGAVVENPWWTTYGIHMCCTPSSNLSKYWCWAPRKCDYRNPRSILEQDQPHLRADVSGTRGLLLEDSHGLWEFLRAPEIYGVTPRQQTRIHKRSHLYVLGCFGIFSKTRR